MEFERTIGSKCSCYFMANVMTAPKAMTFSEKLRCVALAALLISVLSFPFLNDPTPYPDTATKVSGG